APKIARNGLPFIRCVQAPGWLVCGQSWEHRSIPCYILGRDRPTIGPVEKKGLTLCRTRSTFGMDRFLKSRPVNETRGNHEYRLLACTAVAFFLGAAGPGPDPGLPAGQKGNEKGKGSP